MARIDGVLFCDRCGAEITWSPYIVTQSQVSLEPPAAVRHGEYCCQDCAEGRPCQCAERMDLDEERRNTGTTGPYAGW